MSGSVSPLELLAPSLGMRPILRLADLQAKLDAGEAQLWSRENSAIYTEIATFPTTGEMVLEAGPAGGDLQEIEFLIPHIEQAAETWGCTQILVNAGREGWRRVLEKRGYELSHIVMRKILR